MSRTRANFGNRTRGSAFTLVEAVLAIVFVALVLTGAMQAASTSIGAQARAADRAAGRFLAHGLVSELLAKPYEDPNTGSTGVNLNVNGTLANKTTATSINDFNGWTESPPQDPDGNAIPGFSAWTRSVTVQWVNPSDPGTVVTTECGAKLVTVTVKKGGVIMYKSSGLRVRTS